MRQCSGKTSFSSTMTANNFIETTRGMKLLIFRLVEWSLLRWRSVDLSWLFLRELVDKQINDTFWYVSIFFNPTKYSGFASFCLCPCLSVSLSALRNITSCFYWRQKPRNINPTETCSHEGLTFSPFAPVPCWTPSQFLKVISDTKKQRSYNRYISG